MNTPTPSSTDEASDLDVFACPLDGLHLIEASAGTGKTWTICGLYLRLLLEGDRTVQQILVVTFTHAATAELRERIRSRIVDVLGFLRRDTATGDPFAARLVAAVESHGGGDRERMRARLDAALHTFDEAAVFTIHGFCQRALSDTPFVAGLPFTLELLHDDQPLRLQAVSDFWRRHVVGGRIPPMLAEHLSIGKDSPESWARLLARRLAKSHARLIWPDDMGIDPQQIDNHTLDGAFELARRLWGGDGARPTATLLDSLAALNANSYKAEGIRVAAKSWSLWFAGDEALNAPDPETSKTRLFSATFIAGKTRKNQTPPVHPFFAAAAELLAAHASATRALQLARLRLLRQMFDEAGAGLREQKRRQRLLSFDDMLNDVDAALTSGKAPWLAESLRSRYPVALIDEFQDTDPVQFAIFNALYGSTAELPGGPLFLVGDPKQAIYSFRNADLQTYLAARRQTGRPYTLRHNQRSSPALIEACNRLFAINPEAFILEGLRYVPVTVGDKPRAPLIDRGDSNAAALRIWQLPGDGQHLLRAQARNAAVRATAGEVVRLLRAAQAGLITIGERPLAPGDIAILVRSHAQGRLTREALLQLGVGCVELSQQNIFHTPDADDLERVLLAILEPGRPALLYSALATELMGFDADAVATLAGQETRLLQTMSRFSTYRESWLRRGFGVMFRSWLDNESLACRLLARGDGERRLTNLLHLGELLQQADAEYPAPDALLRWLTSKRRADGADEVAQLRLESDRNLVQIVTIHKAKGLEYGIVFCPFLWDGQPSAATDREGCEYHDDSGQAVIDFRTEVSDSEVAEIKWRRRQEQDAEFMRLIYVALTRAVYRCYLVAGCYTTLTFGKRSLTQSSHSLLNWLVAGSGISHNAWHSQQRPAEDIEVAWRALAEAAGPGLSLSDLPSAVGVSLAAATPLAESLRALTPPAQIPAGWRLGSFSSLQHGANSDASASDHDGRSTTASLSLRRSVAPPPDIAADDILRFPRGPAAGDCVHALFESIDFTDSAQWPNAIEQVLLTHPQSLPGPPAADAANSLARMLRRLLDDVLATPLPGGIVLRRVARRQRLVELGFTLPSAGMTSQALNNWLLAHDYRMPGLGFPPLAGYLKGFIDLVFCHADRFHVLDWKSNHLGYTPADYGHAPMAAAMSEHGYHLQYLLYCVAVHRYLRRRLVDYDYDRHFGGVHYLFVRGVRPEWQNPAAEGQPSACGVYFHRPLKSSIVSLDALLGGGPEGSPR
jgi:exodeoxyribonuclease V beta subunit